MTKMTYRERKTKERKALRLKAKKAEIAAALKKEKKAARDAYKDRCKEIDMNARAKRIKAALKRSKNGG